MKHLLYCCSNRSRSDTSIHTGRSTVVVRPAGGRESLHKAHTHRHSQMLSILVSSSSCHKPLCSLSCTTVSLPSGPALTAALASKSICVIVCLSWCLVSFCFSISSASISGTELLHKQVKYSNIKFSNEETHIKYFIRIINWVIIWEMMTYPYRWILWILLSQFIFLSVWMTSNEITTAKMSTWVKSNRFSIHYFNGQVRNESLFHPSQFSNIYCKCLVTLSKCETNICFYI